MEREKEDRGEVEEKKDSGGGIREEGRSGWDGGGEVRKEEESEGKVWKKGENGGMGGGEVREGQVGEWESGE